MNKNYFLIYFISALVVWSCKNNTNGKKQIQSLKDSLIRSAIETNKHPAHFFLKNFKEEKLPLEISENICSSIDVVNDKFLDSISTLIILPTELKKLKLWPISKVKVNDSLYSCLVTCKTFDSNFDFYLLNINYKAELADFKKVATVSSEKSLEVEMRTVFEKNNLINIETTLNKKNAEIIVTTESFEINENGKFAKKK